MVPSVPRSSNLGPSRRTARPVPSSSVTSFPPRGSPGSWYQDFLQAPDFQTGAGPVDQFEAAA